MGSVAFSFASSGRGDSEETLAASGSREVEAVAVAAWKRALVRASADSSEFRVESTVRRALVRARGHGRPSISGLTEIAAARADSAEISAERRASRSATASSQTALRKESSGAVSESPAEQERSNSRTKWECILQIGTAAGSCPNKKSFI
eukprot:CAMPEP_0177761780 /NCGR_PEP_ID=MMETSP0491_2-20121128/5990_1 /TAXON_ID=63592 /ORGANISM="Tetraselmis chuii, Strain PLY429" /LENGTH=149 /DNA_ID=CAMNT_0019277783 /DNA_START=779 /DNA_END=1229 /DNA_ORIENTATION=+